MSAGASLWLGAAVFLVLFCALAAYMWRRPAGRLDLHGKSYHGQYTRAARILTTSGRSRALSIGYAIAILVYVLGHLSLWIPLALAVAQIASQTIVELIKAAYKRQRPEYWLHRLDTGHSFPSGHATTAVVSFVGWAVVIAYSALPFAVKAPLAGLLIVWAVGIDWSRLALGAHYATDILGGTFFGSSVLCALFAGMAAVGVGTM